MRTAIIKSVELTPDYFNEGYDLRWDKNGYGLYAHLYPGEDPDVTIINITRSVLKCFNCDCLTDEIAAIVAKQLKNTRLEYHFDEEVMEYVNSHELHMTLSFSQECNRTKKHPRNHGNGTFHAVPAERPKRALGQRNAHRSSEWPSLVADNSDDSSETTLRRSFMRTLTARMISLINETETL